MQRHPIWGHWQYQTKAWERTYLSALWSRPVSGSSLNKEEERRSGRRRRGLYETLLALAASPTLWVEVDEAHFSLQEDEADEPQPQAVGDNGGAAARPPSRSPLPRPTCLLGITRIRIELEMSTGTKTNLPIFQRQAFSTGLVILVLLLTRCYKYYFFVKEGLCFYLRGKK